MANGNPFAPQGNPFGRSAPAMFTPAQEPFDKALMKKIPIGQPITGNAILSQVPGRFIDVQASEKLNRMGKEWEGMAEEQMPDSTPEATEPLVSPLAAKETSAAPLAPSYSADDRNNFVSQLLGQTGQGDYKMPTKEQYEADKNNYWNASPLAMLNPDTIGVSPYREYDEFSQAVQANQPSQFQRLIDALATDGVNNNANIYNRFGLPGDAWNQVLQWIKENNPSNLTVNDIGGESGNIYDKNRELMDITRQSEKSSDWRNTYAEPIIKGINAVAAAVMGALTGGAAAAPAGALMGSLTSTPAVVGSAVGSGLYGGAMNQGRTGGGFGDYLKGFIPAAAATAATHGLGSVLSGGAAVPVEGPFGGGEITSPFGSQFANTMGTLPAAGATSVPVVSPLATQSAQQVADTSLGDQSVAPAAEPALSMKDLLPITRKIAGEILSQLQGAGQQQSLPYYFQGIPEEYAATQQSPLASAVTNLDELYPGEGGYTYAQMTREPAAEAIGGGASNPFLRKKAAKDAMSRIRQYKSQL